MMAIVLSLPLHECCQWHPANSLAQFTMYVSPCSEWPMSGCVLHYAWSAALCCFVGQFFCNQTELHQ